MPVLKRDIDTPWGLDGWLPAYRVRSARDRDVVDRLIERPVPGRRGEALSGSGSACPSAATLLTDQTGSTSHPSVGGPGLAEIVDQAGNVYVPHADGLGTVRALTDGTGAVVESYQTDPFGVPLRTQGSVA